MGAKPGNQNARRGKHPRVQVPYSGIQLDAMYAFLGIGEHESDPEKIRELAQMTVHDYLYNLDRARCFNGAKCHTGAEEEDTNQMIWCEIGSCYGWYCGLCYEVKHLSKDEGKIALALYREQKEQPFEEGQTPMKEYVLDVQASKGLPTDLQEQFQLEEIMTEDGPEPDTWGIVTSGLSEQQLAVLQSAKQAGHIDDFVYRPMHGEEE